MDPLVLFLVSLSSLIEQSPTGSSKATISSFCMTWVLFFHVESSMQLYLWMELSYGCIDDSYVFLIYVKCV